MVESKSAPGYLSSAGISGPTIVIAIALLGGFWTLSNNYQTIRESGVVAAQIAASNAHYDQLITALQVKNSDFVSHAEAVLADRSTTDRETELQRQIVANHDETKADLTELRERLNEIQAQLGRVAPPPPLH